MAGKVTDYQPGSTWQTGFLETGVEGAPLEVMFTQVFETDVSRFQLLEVPIRD